LWDKALRRKWNLINLYGAAQDENKDRFLAELASFCGHNSEPILIGGDFNIIRFSFEKKTKILGFTLTQTILMPSSQLMNLLMFIWLVVDKPGPIIKTPQL